MAMAKIIQTKRQPMTCWAVLHKTTTRNDKGSIMGGRERERECERNEEGGRTAWVFDLGGQVEVV